MLSINDNTVLIRDMESGVQEIIDINKVKKEIEKRLAKSITKSISKISWGEEGPIPEPWPITFWMFLY